MEPSLTPTLRRTLADLGISQVGFAHLVGVDGSTVRRWISGALATPPWVWLLLDLLQRHPAEVQRLLRDAA